MVRPTYPRRPGSGSETVERTDEIVVDQEQVRNINEAAAIVTKRTMEFHEKHGADMAIDPQEFYRHQQLLILSEQDEYRVKLLNRKRETQSELFVKFRYGQNGGGRR